MIGYFIIRNIVINSIIANNILKTRMILHIAMHLCFDNMTPICSISFSSCISCIMNDKILFLFDSTISIAI